MKNMYFVAIVLPTELDKKVLQHKEYMYDKYGSQVGLKSPAHITLVPPFWLEAEKEEQLFKDIDSLKNFQAFRMQTSNFSAFAPKTIFIALAPNEQLNHLKQMVDEVFQASDQYGIKPDTRPFHPHVTIATRDLHKKDFAGAWPHFSERKFEEEWTVNSISVLRHNKKNWDVIYTSQLQFL